MTVTQLLAEICSRAGEGYQNYTDRAASAFKAAVLSMLYASPNPDTDAPALYKIVRELAPSESSSIRMEDLLFIAGLKEGVIEGIRYAANDNATMTTNLQGDNDITYTSRLPGAEGNLIGIEYVLPPAGQKPVLSFVVTDVERIVGGETVMGKKITVILRTNVSGDVDTDAEYLLSQIVYSEANFYVTASLAPGSMGAGQLSPMSEVMLTGGSGSEEYKRLERITKIQQDIARMNPKLLNSKDDVGFYFITSNNNDAIIDLMSPPPFNMNGMLEYSMIGWTDAIITPVLDELGVDTTNLSTAFAPIFLENAIAMAAERLVKEIMA